MPARGVQQHKKIADYLRGLIKDESIKAGDFLPSEAELCEKFNSSRGPVRQAIASLRAEGLVSSGRGRRSVVLGSFTGENFEVTVRHSDEPDLAGIRAALEEHPDRLALGPWQVSFEILDRVVDDYFPVMDGLETDVDQIEDQLFRRNRGVSRRIYKLSRQVIHVQRAIKELPAMVQQMQRSVESATGAKLDGSHAAHVDDDAAVETLRRLRDVHDHVVHLNDKAASLRTVLENALALDSTLASKRLAEQSIAQNEQTKKISSWAAIIFAPQLIGSIYGMNFDHMPELHWFWGYPFALALMLAVAVTLYVLFKRNDWL